MRWVNSPVEMAQGMTADNLHISQDFIKAVLSGHALAEVSTLAPPPFYILLKSLVLVLGIFFEIGCCGRFGLSCFTCRSSYFPLRGRHISIPQ